MTEYSVTAQQAREHSIELSLQQLIACQYWAKESIPLPHKKTRAHLVGGHLSPFKGRGMEFSEVRQYQAGDDIRTIDWRVTARTGKVHTKIFQEERERPVYIVTDLQDTMFFGSKNRFKSTLACLHSARAFWAAFNSGNRVAGLFSTANDVAKIMQTYLNGGSYGGEKFIDKETIDKYNTCYYCEDDVRRGVGFDKPQLGTSGPTCN